jgi:murein DD-endopeptidase MepM/ murein hydrolase activator NlpD
VTLSREVELRTGQIVSSLFAATDAAGVPDGVASQIADIFAGDIDFQRDLRRGDRFTVAFEMFYHQGRAIRSGRLLAADFNNQKRAYRAVWFQPSEGHGGYYAPDGKNLRKAFLRSPLEYSRITSGFGMRNHPILRQWRAHRGVDYAAPIGTRVRATGDGVVDFAGRRNGYGNVVVLRHNGGFSTYYAHLNGFARGLRRGSRIGQGDIIGYVGQSGWATGPHLHYEFHVRDQYRNPLTLVMPPANPVPHHLLAAFFEAAQPLTAQLDLLKNTDLAMLE